MAYGLKYTLSFLSDRGNDYRIEILAKDYQGAPIAKKMGVAPVLNIAQGDGCIQGTSLTFAVQADVDGELQEFYTTDNKQFRVLLYRNGALMWQGYLLPELYSEAYVAPPYDVSLTATDQLATLKDVEYNRADEQVLLQSVLEYLLSHTQLSLPLSYHMQLSMVPGRPMLENVYINQSAYNGSNCYDVLNAILLSMNCRIMQLGNQWLLTSATDNSENYYIEKNLEVKPHKTLGQMYVADVYPNGTLALVNAPALRGATLEYNHIFKKSILKNADCESRVGWEYMTHSSDDGRIPGEITSFGKIFKAHCWQLMPANIQSNSSLHLWQDIEMPADDGVVYSLSVKHLFSTNAKLLLLAITHWDDKGTQRRLTGAGWVTEWDSSDVNSYIQITGTPKSASLTEYCNIEQYEMSTVQFTLPPSNGTLRIGFINSTANYADPLAYAPIYVTQVYLTLGAVSGSAATTTIEPNATMGQEGVVLAMGDDVDSSNAVNVALNTLRRYDSAAITGWYINDRLFPSYFSMMLQEFSRYFGQKKRQLQGTIMGVDVLANIYKETYSNTVYRLVSADYNLLADEANVTLEEVISNFVQYAEQIFATNNSSSFGSSTSGGSSFAGGSSSVDTSQLLRRDEAAETYTTIKDFNASLITVNKRLNAVESYWYIDDNGNLHTRLNIISDNDIIAGGEYSGSTGGGGTSGFGSITIKTASGQEYTADAKGVVLIPDYQPKGNYLTAVPSGYATESWVGSNYQPKGNYLTAVPVGYATETWVGNNYQPKGNYLTAIPSEYITESELNAKKYLTGITSAMVTTALGYVPFNSTSFTKATIKSTLGIADWALAATKPVYTASEVGALSTGGGTISKSSYVPLVIQNTASDISTILFKGTSGDLGYLGFNGASNPIYMAPSGYAYTLIHTGNIGSYNAGSADMLAKSYSGNINFSAGSALKLIRDWGEDGVSLGYPTKYQAGLSVMTDFVGWQMTVYAGAIPNPYFRSLQDTGVWKEWKQLAFLTDNVASATKLQTARTLWGKSFDGTGDISGNLLNVGLVEPISDNSYNLGSASRKFLYAYVENAITNNSTNGYFIGSRSGLGATDGGALIYAYGNTPISFYTGGERMRILGNGNVLIGTITDTIGKLQVEGDIYATAWIRTKGAAGWYSQDYGGGIYMTDANYVRVYNGKGFQVDGNVLIGTTTDSGDKLRINGAVRAAGHIRLDRYHGASEYLQLEAEDVNINYRAYDTDGWCSHNFYSNDNLLVRIDGYAGKLDVNGNLVVSGDGVFGSDARYKSKLQDLAVDIKTIANAPVFSYRWTDREDDKVHLGTTAQYWLDTNFKDAVDISNKDFFHLNYGALGVAIGVTVAKKVVNHEERILTLERENEALKNELNQLRQWRN